MKPAYGGLLHEVPESGVAAHRLFSWSMPEHARRRQGTHSVCEPAAFDLGSPPVTAGARLWRRRARAGCAAAGWSSFSSNHFPTLCLPNSPASATDAARCAMPPKSFWRSPPSSPTRPCGWTPPPSAFPSAVAKTTNGEPARAAAPYQPNQHTMTDFDFPSFEDFERAADAAIDFLCPKCGEWHPLVQGGCTRT